MPNDVASMLGVPELAAPPPQPAPTAAPAPAAPNLDLPQLGSGAGYVTQEQINAAATSAGVDPDLFTRVIRRESGGQIGALSPKGAIGPAQLTPDTAAGLGVNPNDPIQNLQGGARYLKQQIDRYGGDVSRGLAAYNAGPDAVDKAGGIPNIPETRAYVAAIQGASAQPQGQLADALGLTPQERAALQIAPGPSSPEAGQPGPTNRFNFGPQFGPLSKPAEAYYRKLDDAGQFDLTADWGDPGKPQYVPAGQPVPQTAGYHWVDVNGQEHVNPGGAGERALNALQGAFQGVPVDLGSSLTRMTGGVFGVGTPQQALQADAAQQRAYAIQHLGDPYAQAGRFAGQAALGTAAALASPEFEAPAALGAFGRLAAGGATNALRGVAATAPSVGANPQPVAQQLATGALVGAAAPVLTGAAVGAARGLTGLGRTVSPDVAALADTAQSKYGINLASGQVVGADGNPETRVAYSQALKTDPKAQALNQQQRQAWQQGVTGTYGDPSGDISPEALSASRARIGGVMNDVATRSSISPTASDAVQTRIGQIISDAQKVLPDNEVKPLLNMAQAIGDVRNPQGISGESYQALTRQDAPLDRLENSDNSNVAHYASQIHDALNDGLAASSSPEDVETLRNARFQYKNLMTVAKAARNQNNIGIDGVLTPNALNTATTSNFKNRAFQGAGDLDELNSIRKQFMSEPPDSGTQSRIKEMVQSGVAGLATGGAVDIGLGLLHQPETAIPTGLSALAGTGAKLAADAIKRNKVVGSAAGIVSRSLPNAPGSALAGVGSAVKAIEIPLSALAGVRTTQLQPVTP